MKKLNKFIPLVVLAALLSTIGWTNFTETGNNNITNYYYYQGHRFYLNQKTDMIFIKLKHEISKTDFESMISSIGTIPADYSFEKNDVRQFVKLRAGLDNVSLNNVISLMSNNSLVADASPAFSMIEGTGNANTLIGCEDNIIVQFKFSYTKDEINRYISSKGMTIKKELELTGGFSYILQLPATTGSKTSIDFANEVYETGMVNFADPGFFQTNLLQFVPNDTFFPMQWSAINTGTNIPVTGTGTADCDMGLDTAWNITLGSTKCIVGVVDTGMDTTHPDCAANVLHGYNYNYYADVYGGFDDYGHGASTAGIIGSVGNNNLGTSGVCPTVRVFAAKIFNSAGSTTNTAIVNGLIGVRTFGNCWISSNSWGGGAPIAAADQAITDGTTLGRGGKGIVWCFATGNGNGALSWPSTHANVISVGGVSPCNQRKSPSSCDLENFWGANYGTGLDIVAPCVKIYAPVQGGTYTQSFNGTSSATPNAAGVCALMLSKDSLQTWDTVRQRVDRSALKKGAYIYTSAGPLVNLGNTWNNEMGYGEINAATALATVGGGVVAVNDVSAGPFLSLPGSFVVGTNYSIKARFTNLGTAPQTNIPTRFSVNSTVAGTGNIASLPAGANDSAAFPWNPAAPGTYTLRIYHSMAVDENRLNDTVTTTVIVTPTTTIPVLTNICRNGLNKNITDNNTIYDTININIPNAFNVIDVNCKIDTVTHTWDSDLGFNLIHLAANVNIINHVGGSGDNFIGTILNDSAVTPIASGTAPFTGSFKPSFALTPFNNNPINGAWILAVNDNAAGDTGYLKAWCLTIIYQGLIGGINTVEIPNYYSLSQNYPNPFNPSTTIKYGIPKSGIVTLKIYDILGKEVATLVNERKDPGVYTVDFNASNLASGVYLYKIESGEFTAVKKLLLVK
jgi:subtilase family protein/type IX secretion system substrate protein/CARDB protein/proprotein convertase P-domain-containing protein